MAMEATSATALKQLASWYWREGLLAESEKLFRVAICMQERDRGPDHMDVAVTLYQLAEVCADQDKFTEAESYYKRAVDIYEEHHQDSPDSLLYLSVLLKLHELSEQELTDAAAKKRTAA